MPVRGREAAASGPGQPIPPHRVPRRGAERTKKMEGAAVAGAPSVWSLWSSSLLKTMPCAASDSSCEPSTGDGRLLFGYFFFRRRFLPAFFVAFLVALFFLRLAMSVTSFLRAKV